MEMIWSIIVNPSPYTVFSTGQLGVVKDYLFNPQGELLDIFIHHGETFASKILYLMRNGEVEHTSKVIVPLPDGTFTARVLALFTWKGGLLIREESRTDVRVYVSLDNQRLPFKGQLKGKPTDVPVPTGTVKALKLAYPLDDDILIDIKTKMVQGDIIGGELL